MFADKSQNTVIAGYNKNKIGKKVLVITDFVVSENLVAGTFKLWV